MMSSFSQRRMTNSFSALFKLLPIDIRDFYEISLHSFSSLNLYIIFTFLSSSSTFLPQFFCLSSMGGSHIVWFITLLPCLLTRSRISLPVISCVLEALLPLLGGKWLKKKKIICNLSLFSFLFLQTCRLLMDYRGHNTTMQYDASSVASRFLHSNIAQPVWIQNSFVLRLMFSFYLVIIYTYIYI